MGTGTAGFAGPTSPEVQDALRLRLNWHDGGGEGSAQIRAVIAACVAVEAGLARHVLVYRTVTESTAQGAGGRQGIGGSGGGGGMPRFSGFMQWTLPFGAVSAVNWIAWVAQRRFHEFGLTRQQLGQIALNGRRNAELNPKAVYREPMTMEDYLAARMISTPLCLFDCDAPCDGSTAVIVSHADYAPDTPKPACHVNAMGTALRGRPSWDQFDDMTTMAARDAGASHVGAHRPATGRRGRGPALRRVQHLDHGLAGGPRLLRAGRERPVRRGRRRASPATACCRSTPPAGSCRAVASTASACCTRPACSCAARAASARSPATPRWRWWPTAEARSPGRCC